MPLIKNELGCNSFVGLLLFPFEGFRKFQLANGFMIVINKTSTLNKYDFKVVTSFTCNWAKDFDGNGYDFSDFHGIKRSFIQNDNIQIVTGYTSEKSGEWKLEVYSNSNGSTVWTDTGLITKGGNFIFSKITEMNLPIGVYIYNITLNSSDNDKVSKSEKFEIIEE